MSNTFIQDFSNLVNAGFPYIYIPSYEEERITGTIESVMQNNELIKTPRKLYTWTQTDGLVCEGKIARDTEAPVRAIEAIAKNDEPSVYLLKDFHVYFGGDRTSRPDYAVIRRLRDIIPALKTGRKTVVFISSKLVIPCDMEKEISILDFALPSVEDIEAMLRDLIQGINPANVNLTDDDITLLSRSALGLTLQEAENAFCRAIVNLRGIDRSAISIIHEEKNQVVKKTGVLEFVKSDLDINDIGGLENLKTWLLRRNNSWSDKAKAYGLPAPKGVLITGVPGCGKSLTAKAMSAIWGLPLLKLDMGKIFGGIVGSSEENMRKAIATAEAVSPSILWVDEIEKGFSGLKSGGDSGTSARVFGTFLTWMQEKTEPVFVIATANDISSLPPELLRKGRFDEIFFVDLPTTNERKKIFNLHINKRIKNSTIQHEIEANDEVCTELARMTAGYVGAEIEQIVIAAMYEAFYADRGLRKEDIIKSIKETVPLSLTQREQIIALREWAKERAVLATAEDDREQQPTDSGTPDDGGFLGSQGGRIVDFNL
ncbi:MAG: AAA family ATPase [Eubacterium sp.]|nr:AAA family ATPase [Eubacterium sp.]MBR1530886.1 AAA family ATPase [Eubacterium sp.]MBR2278514.1 AAA family ATPase [Eubacterium sp.]